MTEDTERYIEFLAELTKLCRKHDVSVSFDKEGMHLCDGAVWYALYANASSEARIAIMKGENSIEWRTPALFQGDGP